MPEIQEMNGINLYSDTQTYPTDAMRKAMYNARVGDDMFREDPTVLELEALAAKMAGTEAALFVPSGHMGNLIATMSHCSPGDEVILEADSHMYYYESGSIATIANVMPQLVRGVNGVFDATDVEAILRDKNIHYPPTTLLCVENSHNRSGGTVVPLENIERLRTLTQERGIAMHLDGARVFNAACALGVDASKIISYFDSAMFCLSKGLSAPIGSMLVGSEAFIDKAYRKRKLIGGGMRQVGVLAAAGIVALTKMVDRLPEDHVRARRLAEGLSKLSSVAIDLNTVQTNIVIINVQGLGITAKEYAERLMELGVKVSPRPPYQVRFVTHRHIQDKHIEATLKAAAKISEALKGA